ncbi:MAG: uroporphyrinogen-III synthase [Hyphomicrobium sp.]
MKHILVTRPEPDAWTSKIQMENLGLKASLAPLIEIAFDEISPDALEGAKGLIVTSRNAMRSLALSTLLDRILHMQVYAVGEATGLAAKELKFANVTAARGTAEDLVPVIAERHRGKPGHLIHLAGDHVATDLVGDLAAEGVSVRTVVVYRSIAAEVLPPLVNGGLKTGAIDAVALMSPRTAEIWSALADKSGLASQLPNITHICLSEAVADKLQHIPNARIEIAVQPNAQDFLALIRRLAEQST